LLKLRQDNIIESDQNVVCIVTGSGIGISDPDRISSGSSINPVSSWRVLQAQNTIRRSKKKLANKVKSRLDSENVSIGTTKRKILFLLNKKPDYAYSLHKRLLLNDKDHGYIYIISTSKRT
jgi:hypothetical protein